MRQQFSNENVGSSTPNGEGGFRSGFENEFYLDEYF